jgi:uncharacterized protein (TIGR02001 family)
MKPFPRSIAGACAALLVSSAAYAELTVTPALVSDYDFRGVTQSAKDPALQLDVNFATPGGLYFGVWGSTLDFGPGIDTDVEIDAYVGYAWGDALYGIGFDVGIVYQTYPGESDFNYPEAYAGLAAGPLSARVWYSWDYGNTGHDGWYVEANADHPIGNGFSLLAHVGYSGGDYWDTFYGDGYVDWSVGVGKRLGFFDVQLRYVDGSDLPDGGVDLFSSDGRLWASISTTLPWARD